MCLTLERIGGEVTTIELSATRSLTAIVTPPKQTFYSISPLACSISDQLIVLKVKVFRENSFFVVSRGRS
jgi:hypothetical protein